MSETPMSNHSEFTIGTRDDPTAPVDPVGYVIDYITDQRDRLLEENAELRAQIHKLAKNVTAANRGAQINAHINRELVDRIAAAEEALKPVPWQKHRRPNKYGYWNDY